MYLSTRLKRTQTNKLAIPEPSGRAFQQDDVAGLHDRTSAGVSHEQEPVSRFADLERKAETVEHVEGKKFALGI